jgi:hypothetical protein
MSSSDLPQIVINYSPQLDLRIACVKAERYRPTGRIEYYFEVKCKLRHPSGTFEYSAADQNMDPNSFARFGENLRGIQQGARNDAVLEAVTETLELRLQGNSRKLQAELKIREYISLRAATLASSLEVDYDLFVNKLVGEVERFVGELRLVEPDEVG